MVELSSLQQILSMSSGPEKVQQVQQQQPDMQGRHFAAEFRELADHQKNQVQESEQGNESNNVSDKKEFGKRREERERKEKEARDDAIKSEKIKVDEVRQGKLVDIVV